VDLNEARDGWGIGMHWHQLDHMQTICTLLQTVNHTNTSSVDFHRLDALPGTQWCQCTEGFPLRVEIFNPVTFVLLYFLCFLLFIVATV